MDLTQIVSGIDEAIKAKQSQLEKLPDEIKALQTARAALTRVEGVTVSSVAQVTATTPELHAQSSNGQNHNGSTSAHQETLLPQPTSRKRNSLPKGFSLTESIIALLPEIEGEISQPVIYDKLVAKYPEVAPFIQRASIATTLGKLEGRGFLEVTDKGYGSQPRLYKRIIKETVNVEA